MTGLTLLLRYAAFAVLAILANLAAQRMLLAVFPNAYIPALAGGTIIGLVVKYALDRTWIFAGAAHARAGQAGTFGLYAATGVFTTLIFWGFETVAWLVWQTHMAREAGAVTGLVLGYAIKYQLDRRYVFTQPRPA
ncbi:MAG: GtrA family protein [Blastomonas fulva]|jgi:putative flippase GtrA|uniref:GtrA family protein n=1 Tax=Blastomonas fulva TaxID=1550728 RepID=UPI004034B712